MSTSISAFAPRRFANPARPVLASLLLTLAVYAVFSLAIPAAASSRAGHLEVRSARAERLLLADQPGR